MTTPSYPETLHVVRLDRSVDKSGADLPPAFLEVGQWTYPLVRGRSPVMRSNYGGYMFPDLEKSDVTGGKKVIDVVKNNQDHMVSSINT